MQSKEIKCYEVSNFIEEELILRNQNLINSRIPNDLLISSLSKYYFLTQERIKKFIENKKYEDKNILSENLKQVLNSGINDYIVEVLNEIGLETALMWAVKRGHVDVVEAIVEYLNNLNKDFNFGKSNGFFVNHHDKNGLTALMIAADSGYLKCVDVLLTAPGVDPNDQNKEGLTALHIANNKGHLDVMTKLLLSEKIQIDLTKKEDCKALTSLANSAKHSQIVVNFLKERYLPNYYNKRKEADEYKHWYGRFFGQNKNEKLKTANKLLSDQDVSNDKAIKGGELGAVYRLLKLAEKTSQLQSLTKNCN